MKPKPVKLFSATGTKEYRFSATHEGKVSKGTVKARNVAHAASLAARNDFCTRISISLISK